MKTQSIIRVGLKTKDPEGNAKVIPVERFRVIGRYNEVTGESWQVGSTSVALMYALRVQLAGLPIDDDVIYGCDVEHGLGLLVHTSEVVW